MSRNKPPLKNIWKNGLCVGCGACEAVCPEQIIKLDYSDGKSLYQAMVPLAIEKVCTGCGFCYRVCPFVKNSVDANKSKISIQTALPELLDWLTGPYKKIYTGYAVDSNLRYMSSSGGVATALLIYLLKTNKIDGALVASPIRGNAIRHKINLVKNVEDIISNRGTVYTQIDYSGIWQVLQENKDQLAIMGLPCYLKAVDLFMATKKLDTSRIFKIGLFCSGMSKYRALEYLCKRKKIDPDKVLHIRYRSGGWPGRKMIVTIPDPKDPFNTKEIVLFERDESLLQKYLYSFCFSGPFFLKCCLICRDQTAECADISLGDAWLPRFTSSDSSGTNIIISRTTCGQKIIREVFHKGSIFLQEAHSEDVLNSQGGLVGKKLGIFGKHLKNNSLSAQELKVCKRYIPQYIPGKRALIEKRLYRWFAECLPSAFAFLCFVVFKLLNDACTKFILMMKNIFKGGQ